MEAKSPVLSDAYASDEVIFAKNQPEYTQLPALRDRRGVVLTRWAFTDAERAAVASGADLFLFIVTGNYPLQPVALEISGHDRTLEDVAKLMGLEEDENEPEV